MPSRHRAAASSLVAGVLLVAPAARAQWDDDPSRAIPGPEPAPLPLDPSAPPPPDPRPPPEPRVAPFGSRGQWVISGSSSAGYSTQSFSSSSAVFSGGSFGPTVDWFVARNVSLGLATSLSYSDNTGYGADGSLVDTKTTALHAGPRVGVNLPLARTVSLWPAATLGFEWIQQQQSLVSGGTTSVSANPLGYPSTTSFGPYLTVEAALLWHVVPHLFVGIVPSLFHDFAHAQGGPDVGGQETHVAVGFLLGGWFGGPRTASELDPPALPAGVAPRRFGQAGQTVLSNELVLDGYWTGYAGSSSGDSGGSVTLAVDQFVVDHFSLGAFLTGSYGTSRGIDATTGQTVTSEATGGGLGVRVGADLPLGERVSFWPRASLGYTAVFKHETETSTNEDDEAIVTFGLYAPLLLHPASHFFVGFGPSVSRDLSRAVSSGGTASMQNQSTTLGLGLTVGGWL